MELEGLITCYKKPHYGITSSWRSVIADVNRDATLADIHHSIAEYPLYRLWYPKFGWGDSNFDHLPDDIRHHTVEGARDYLHSIVRQDWFRSSFDTSEWEPIDIKNVSKSSPNEKFDFIAGARAIRVPSVMRRHMIVPSIQLTEPLSRSTVRPVLLHELAHIANHKSHMFWDPRSREPGIPTRTDEQALNSHGPTFRGNFLHILHHAMGPQYAKRLASGYRKMDLDWDFDSIDPRRHVPELSLEANKDNIYYPSPEEKE